MHMPIQRHALDSPRPLRKGGVRYVCTYMYIYANMHIYVCKSIIPLRKWNPVHALVHVYTYMYIYIYICIYIYPYIYSLICLYMYGSTIPAKKDESSLL